MGVIMMSHRDVIMTGLSCCCRRQDSEIVVEFKPLEDTVDPSNMLCAGKVCTSPDPPDPDPL